MKRTEIDTAIDRALASAKKHHVALPLWAPWSPDQFGPDADGIFRQKLGWKVIDFGFDNFAECGLVLFALCSPLVDEFGEPVNGPQKINGHDYPVTSFSRKFLFVQAGQTEPHHFHRQKARKEVTVVAGAPVRFELAWGESDTKLSDRDVDVSVDGIWHHMPAGGSVTLQPGQTITLPGDLSHIISVAKGGDDSILMETSTANNDRIDNIFPLRAPENKPVLEDAPARYRQLDAHVSAAAHK